MKDEITGVSVRGESGHHGAGGAYASANGCGYCEPDRPFWLWGVSAQRQADTVLWISGKRGGPEQEQCTDARRGGYCTVFRWGYRLW